MKGRGWVERTCTFAFQATTTHDMAKIVEAVLIQALGPRGYLLTQDHDRR